MSGDPREAPAHHPVWSWIAGWTAGWSTHAPDAVARLYAEDAVFVSHPFRAPERPGDYAAHAFQAEDEVEFWFARPRTHGTDAAVEYWAVIGHKGRWTTIAGTSLLRFGPNGLVVEHRDYWAEREGALALPEGWPVASHGRHPS